jgi:ABC-type antimicrobial peptide transport system permease subunit
MYVAVRVSGGPDLPQRLREAVARVDADVPVTAFKTQDQQIEESIGRERAVSTLLVSFGLFALLLAAIGLHGVTAYAVARRTSEIGIRMALGAQRRDVGWLVLRQGVVLVAGGLLVGIPAAAATSRLARALLFGVDPVDPWSLAAGSAVLCGTALAGGLLPARHAMRLDPLVALRRE